MSTAPTRRPALMQHRPAAGARWQSAALALLLAGGSVLAQPTSKPAGKPATTKTSAASSSKVAKPATARQKLKNEASGLALATETAETINEIQLAIAARVLTGTADCEFNQRVSVAPLAGKDGFFTVTHKNQRYTMVPRETATGAVRLEDKAAGVVWLQIPTKSMLMNARIGQRMVDSCLHAEQRAALAAVAGAAGGAQGQGIGIVAQPAAPVAAAPPASAPAPVALPAPAASAASAPLDRPAMPTTPDTPATPVAPATPTTPAAPAAPAASASN